MEIQEQARGFPRHALGSRDHHAVVVPRYGPERQQPRARAKDEEHRDERLVMSLIRHVLVQQM